MTQTLFCALDRVSTMNVTSMVPPEHDSDCMEAGYVHSTGLDYDGHDM